jgi:formate dehydrogenase gamma subunit
MFVYVMMDLIRHIINVAREKQVKRMEPVDVVQHVILATSFFILVVTGFSLRYYDTWYGRLLFGFEGGSQLRGLTHRIAGVVLMAASLIHTAFLFTARGRVFFKDMFPRLSDISDAWSMVVYLLGRRAHPPRMGRFTFAEKVEYWALVWGTAIMAVTGCILWLKNAILFPKLLLDICLVVHSYEAWLAFLAILVWHLYHTVFSPKVYPLNMACLTGKMPERVYVEEHAATVDGHSPAAQKPFGGGDTDK